MVTYWRLIETSPMNGQSNMAVDEALLDSYINLKTLPVLRFYQWAPPALSIGRNQNIEDINLSFCRESGIDVIRRPTGGKAVLHEGEFTYSVIAGNSAGISDKIIDSYKHISKALIEGVKKLKNTVILNTGNQLSSDYKKHAFCFNSSNEADLNFEGSKIIGSAQLRRESSFLQHGSVLVNQDFKKLENMFKDKLKTDLINLKDIIGFVPSYDNLKNCILEGFKEVFKIEFIYDSLSENENKLSEEYFLKYTKLQVI